MTPTLLAAPAAARDATSAELAELARRAGEEPAALVELQQVRTVDGRPVDLGAALAGAEGDELRGRLRALADRSGGSRGASTGARVEAERILDSRRFNPVEAPRPLRGVLRELGRRLREALEPVGRVWGRVADSPIGQVVLPAAAVGLAALVSVSVIRRRRVGSVPRVRAPGTPPPRDDPVVLEHQADQAAAAGDLRSAVRLRFRAGLVRLDLAGVVAYRPSLTSGGLIERLGSPTFDRLATAFDEIAYGGRAAERHDVDAARAGWPAVLEEARRRGS